MTDSSCLQGVYSPAGHSNSLLNLCSGFEVLKNFEFCSNKSICVQLNISLLF